MKHFSLLIVVLCISLSSYAQNGKSKNNDEFQNGEDTFIQKKNLVVKQNLYVEKNTEFRGTLKTTGLSFFNSPVSVGSFEQPTETLDIFGNVKTRGTIFSESLNNQFSAEIGEDLTIGRDLFVTRYGYFEKVGIGITGTLSESLEVEGNIKASQTLLADGLEINSGEVTNDLNVGGNVTVIGNITGSDDVVSQTVSTTELTSETVAISNSLTVEGPASLNQSVNIQGETSIENNLSINGNSYISGNLGVGVEKAPDGFAVAIAGDILTTEVTIRRKMDWPDYVFADGYELPDLAAVEQYIRKNGHLSEIPSVTEVQEDGIHIGEMNVLLLKKIEELTLYVIDLKKENEEIKKILEEYKKQFSGE